MTTWVATNVFYYQNDDNVTKRRYLARHTIITFLSHLKIFATLAKGDIKNVHSPTSQVNNVFLNGYLKKRRYILHVFILPVKRSIDQFICLILTLYMLQRQDKKIACMLCTFRLNITVGNKGAVHAINKLCYD